MYNTCSHSSSQAFRDMRRSRDAGFAAHYKFWVPDEEHVFCQGLLQDEGEEETTFKLSPSGKTVSVPNRIAKNLGAVLDDHLKGVSDIVSMDSVTPGAMISTLEKRYSRNEMYTNIDRLVISVNPFQNLPIYASDYIDLYAKAADTSALPPHVYGVGANAIQGIFDFKKDQAVLVSGESGAGKTEATKSILAYIAEVAGSKAGIQDRILNTTPVLESFGNAKTERNNNSSRFGKWIDIQFDKHDNSISGARLKEFIFEKNRVAEQQELERGFHIFYQLMYGPLAGKYDLEGDNRKYAALAKSSPTADGVDDVAELDSTLLAFEQLGFSDAEVHDVFSLIAGCLHVQNCEFEDAMVDGGEGCRLVHGKPIETATKHFGIDAAALSEAMTCRKLVVGKEVTKRVQGSQKAYNAMRTMAKLFYDRMFSWLIARLNRTLVSGDQKSSPAAACNSIGVLDIAGFECFVLNTFEQLSINLSNEHLQQFFNEFMFKMELADYESEGVPVEDIAFIDNADILECIGGKTGSIMALLDNEMIVPQASDVAYVKRLGKELKGCRRFLANRFESSCEFTLEHYAGRVTYSADEWLNKNDDAPPQGLPELMLGSSNGLVRELGETMVRQEQQGRQTRRKKYVSTLFREDLASLMGAIRASQPHFVRCIKPNSEKVPSLFKRHMVYEQLMYSGAMEAVKIRQAGYPLRMTMREFLGRYNMVFPPELKVEMKRKHRVRTLEHRELLQDIFAKLPALLGASDFELGPNEFAVGKTKVFVRSCGQKALDSARRYALTGVVTVLQKHARGWRDRRRVRVAVRLNREISTFFRENSTLYTAPGTNAGAVFGDVAAIAAEVARAKKTLAQLAKARPVPKRAAEYEEAMANLESELALVARQEALLQSLEILEVERAIGELAQLRFAEGDALFAALLARQRKISSQGALKRALLALDLSTPLEPGAGESEDERVMQLLRVQHACKESGLGSAAGDWADPKCAAAFVECGELLLQVENLADFVKKLLKELGKDDAAFGELIEKAQADGDVALVKKLHGRMKARKSVVANLHGANKDVMKELDWAIFECNRDLIGEKMSEAIDQGVDEGELGGVDAGELGAARKAYRDLQSGDLVAAELRATLQALERAPSESERVALARRGANLLGAGRDLRARDGVLLELGRELKRLAARRGTLFAQGADRRTVEAGLSMYGDLATCPLANPDLVRPFRTEDGRSIGPMQETGALSWTRHKLPTSLTRLPAAQVPAALAVHRNIVGWMHDRPLSESKRSPLAYAIVLKAQSEPLLGAEVYMQLMKQLTNNPNPRSELLGWKAMSFMSQYVEPEAELVEYLRAFLMKATLRMRGNADARVVEMLGIVGICFDKLQEAGGADKGAAKETITVAISLMDDTHRKLKVDQDCDLSQLSAMLAQQLSLTTNPHEFSFFQLTEGLESHRLLPDHANVWALFEKWSQLHKATGRSSRLLWKRRYLKPREELNPNDIMHAHLVTRQARLEHLRYPIPESDEKIAACAAAILLLDGNAWREQLELGAFTERELQMLIPGVHYGHSQNLWSGLIMAEWRRTFQYFRSAPPIQQMERVLKEFQGLRVFGGHYWLGTQTGAVAEDLKAMQRMPGDQLPVNRRSKDSRYWIAVTIDGICFVDTDRESAFIRKFRYSEESSDRLLRWGAKQNLLQFIVQAYHPEKARKREGRIPLTIAIECAAAIDVAYVVHRISADSFNDREQGSSDEGTASEAVARDAKAARSERRRTRQEEHGEAEGAESERRKLRREEKKRRKAEEALAADAAKPAVALLAAESAQPAHDALQQRIMMEQEKLTKLKREGKEERRRRRAEETGIAGGGEEDGGKKKKSEMTEEELLERAARKREKEERRERKEGERAARRE